MQSSPSQHSPIGAQTNTKNVQNTSGDQNVSQILTRPRLQELIREIDPTAQLEEEVEESLMQLADDFIDTTFNGACSMAKHRHAPTVEARDVQFYLEHIWNMWIPGFGTEDLKQAKKSTVMEAHKQRMALIRKSMKK